jgi:hypothetical protein
VSASITDRSVRHLVEPEWVGHVVTRRERHGRDVANIVIRAQVLAVAAAITRTMIVSSSASLAATAVDSVGESLPG